jgi:hypothetical protein
VLLVSFVGIMADTGPRHDKIVCFHGLVIRTRKRGCWTKGTSQVRSKVSMQVGHDIYHAPREFWKYS